MSMQSFVLAILFLSTTVYAQHKVGDVTFPSTMNAGATSLIYNGGGVREKLFIDLYAGALYTKVRSSNPEQIINADEPMAFRIIIVSGLITSEKMIEATLEGFRKSTDGNLKPVQAKIDKFVEAFSGELSVGDTFDMIYWNSSMQVIKNGKVKGNIPGLDFKKAALGIWLSDDPVSESLKDDLLGK